MPGYDQYVRMQPILGGAVVSGAATDVQWADDGSSVGYRSAGRSYRFSFATMSAVPAELPAPATGGRGGGGRRGGAPPASGRGGGMEQAQTEMSATPINGCPTLPTPRGRQIDCVISPDGKRKAFYRSRNLWIANVDGSGERQVTTDGSEQTRVKYGTGSWVYGEELAQEEAIWWAPDSRRVGFYRFDESQVKDYFVAMNQSAVQATIDVEAYPKAGAANPIADVLVYDVTSAQTIKVDARDGQPFSDAMGHYVYGIEWRRDGSELLLQRANRKQQAVELAACNPVTGKCRLVLRESSSTGWLNAGIDPRINPALIPVWLADGRRFIWESNRNGWTNFYLYDISGALLNPISSNTADAGAIVRIDEARNALFYTARDGDNYLKLQLHRVGLDGKGDVRLTNPAFTHSVNLSPDGRFFVDTYQTHDRPPASQIVDASGKVLGQLGASDTTKFDQAGLRKAELFSYLAADGKTPLFGQISFPSNFDPAKKYPVLVHVYGGPVLISTVPTGTFVGPNPTAEYGFLMVLLGYRGVPGTGRAGADALYLKLGITEVDDMAQGVRALATRPYVDKERVGIYGTSYGGYAGLMALLRYPDLFAAASAASPVTDWRNYDTTYTERFMSLPSENKEGYDRGSALTYAGNLRGRLLLYYGTADNNVHPSNSLQLIQAFARAGKSIEVQVGTDLPHSGVNMQRMMEFFIENLVMHPERVRVN